jgi:hypothetical protein
MDKTDLSLSQVQLPVGKNSQPYSYIMDSMEKSYTPGSGKYNVEKSFQRIKRSSSAWGMAMKTKEIKFQTDTVGPAAYNVKTNTLVKYGAMMSLMPHFH